LLAFHAEAHVSCTQIRNINNIKWPKPSHIEVRKLA
jgi:hypothetical protein